MLLPSIRAIADAIIYQGSHLYSSRRPALKPSHRWMFGGLFPLAYSRGRQERWSMQCECLLLGGPETAITVDMRFLSGDEAVQAECPVSPRLLGELALNPLLVDFRQAETEIRSTVLLSAKSFGGGLWKLGLGIGNDSLISDEGGQCRDRAEAVAMGSTHAVLTVSGGAFFSLADPPELLRDLARDCLIDGCWPALVGAEGSTDRILAAPMILSDYPRIAADGFDLYEADDLDAILAARRDA